MEKMEGSFPPSMKAEVDALVRSGSTHSQAAALLTPRVSRSQRMMTPDLSAPRRMHHKIPHKFQMGLNTRATKCDVCLGSVPFVRQASKCQSKKFWDLGL